MYRDELKKVFTKTTKSPNPVDCVFCEYNSKSQNKNIPFIRVNGESRLITTSRSWYETFLFEASCTQCGCVFQCDEDGDKIILKKNDFFNEVILPIIRESTNKLRKIEEQQISMGIRCTLSEEATYDTGFGVKYSDANRFLFKNKVKSSVELGQNND